MQAYNEETNTLMETELSENLVSDIEGKWVWSIVSYSTSEDRAYLGLYFYESDTWLFHELVAPKKLPLPTLKFIAGPSFGVRGINGYYFDTRFEFEFFGTEDAVKAFYTNEVNAPAGLKNVESETEDGENSVKLLHSEAFFDATVGSPPHLEDLHEKFAGERIYGVRGWFKFAGDQLVDQSNRMVFRLTINNPLKYENRDDSRLGDRVLCLLIQADGELLFDSYTYNNDWSVGGETNLEY